MPQIHDELLMGLFMNLGGILASESKTSEAIAALKDKHPKAFSQVDFYSEKEDRVLAFFDEYADGIEEAMADLSLHLSCPVFWFHIHDEDLWMYKLYQTGIEVDRFNTHPGYWAKVDDSERQSWAGNADKISEVWTEVAPSAIDRYLVDHESGDFSGEAKAYESDEFAAWDCWQMADFTAKLGLPYPQAR